MFDFILPLSFMYGCEYNHTQLLHKNVLIDYHEDRTWNPICNRWTRGKTVIKEQVTIN